ncbi:Similar to AAEL008004: Elongation of very long chain fatty acids protein AAEL008004 (Aedes aegypti) [Cotesia congregata]|uniref:Elongation of very long chain fatty acids protein n=1 Tax=Cotesia congregata TaxID=51543 RepID=A0A8J2MPS7_COTCN|nr:Similar to AAEL008004: Elongation of very long chain fatty acids protein AAEL008004 (Aedes aegypti) [Cotesia congregata]
MKLQMAVMLKAISDNYHHIMDEKSDPRVNNWFMMSSPLPTLAICICYGYFSKVMGPKLMENRKPFSLKRTMIIYNLFQVIFSAWLFYEGLASGWWNDYSFRCQPVDYSTNPKALRMAGSSWWYYISKFTELLDTLFFVLRKKNNQISALHVIHHGIMPLSTWVGVKFIPGGHSTFFGLLNTFVHIVMYGYYLLAALGPRVKPYLWWKKYLTALQITQFVLIMIHAFQLLFIKCDYPKAFAGWIGLHAILFFFLFKSFYEESYTKKTVKNLPKSVEEEKTANIYSNNNNNNNKNNNNNNNDKYSNSRKPNKENFTNDFNDYELINGFNNNLRIRVNINNHNADKSIK